MKPNFILAGAPRAGTTWIAKNLKEHPDVYMPEIKEIHFFDINYAKGMEYYESFFKNASNQLAIGEGTPDYLYIKKIPELIHKHLPDTKIIFSLRNPVERLYSRYWNSKAKYKANKNLSFEEKIKEKPLFIEEGFYVDHLKRYYEYFPHENILIMLFEDIAKQPEDFMREIYLFLGINTHFKSPLLLNRINSASSKKGLAKYPILYNFNRVILKMRLFGIANYIDKINTKPYPPMSEETKEWLINDIYGEKNHELAKLIGRDLSAWSN